MSLSISVAMTTYNGQRFLWEQLRSLTVQTLMPAELVVSDDGSTDDTRVILERFAAHAPFPVRVLPPHERLGFADNFLHAAAACRSELVAFCDQDDVWLPNKLATAEARMTADDSLLSMHRLALTDEALTPIGVQDQGIVADRCLQPLETDPYNSGWGNTMMFRRELATLISRERRPRQPEGDKLLSHDHWIYSLATLLGRVSQIREPLILYRQHEANVFGTTSTGRLTRMAHHLDTVRTVPIFTYRERALFDAAMARLIADFAAQVSDPWRTSAEHAAARLADRAERRARRVRLYDGSSIAKRARVYAELVRAPTLNVEAAQARRRALGKDLFLGVLGFGRRR